MSLAFCKYLIRKGLTSDAGALYGLVFAEPDPHIYRRGYDEVVDMLDAGDFLVATTPSGEVVGACYVKVPDPESDSMEAEFGGAFVKETHRARGVAGAMARLALANHRVAYFQESEEMIAHVHVRNDKPRPLLNNLGFTLDPSDANQPFDPGVITGLQHMPTGEDGLVYADVFRLPAQAYGNLLRAAIQVPGLRAAPSGVSVEFNVSLNSLTSGAMADLLADLQPNE